MHGYRKSCKYPHEYVKKTRNCKRLQEALRRILPGSSSTHRMNAGASFDVCTEGPVGVSWVLPKECLLNKKESSPRPGVAEGSWKVVEALLEQKILLSLRGATLSRYVKYACMRTWHCFSVVCHWVSPMVPKLLISLLQSTSPKGKPNIFRP